MSLDLPRTARYLSPRGDSEILRIDNDHASAEVALLGGHVLSYIPQAASDLLYLSESARYEVGGSIRGGIPVCWPWFGDHEGGALPAHGFVRDRTWSLRGASDGDDGSTTVRLEIASDDHTRAIWPHDFRLRIEVTVGAALHVALVVDNPGGEPFEYGGALHTYLRVGDIDDVSVDGLSGLDYLDKVRGMTRHRQVGWLEIDGETDRVFLDTEGDIRVEDRSLGRTVLVTRPHSRTAVVWNPGPDKGPRMSDLDNHRTMLCVESAQAFDDRRTVAPGATSRLETRIALV